MDLLVFALCMYYFAKKYDIFCASSFRLRLREGKFEIILLNMGSHPKPNVLFGPREPLVLPLVNPPVRAKNLDTYIQAYMPHESLGDSPNQPYTV